MTPLHRGCELLNNAGCKPFGVATLKEYVQIIREVAEYYSLPVLDLFAVSGIQPAIKEVQEYYLPDGLHPNDNGNAVIAARLKSFLETL